MLERAENEGFERQKRTKMAILCSGMVAASLAAPIGAQHYPPRALRSASGSSAPGNRLPQPTTQPAAVHATVSKQPGYLLPLMPPWRYSRGTTAKKLPPAHLSPYNLSPCMLPQPAAKTYLPLILPCIPPDNLPAAHTTVHTAVALPPRKCRRACRRGILPCDGSRAQRAGDSDVGANDKGAGDDPGDGVDAH